jgi:hypothetical protein
MKMRVGIPYKAGKLLDKLRKEQEALNPKPKKARTRRKKVEGE